MALRPSWTGHLRISLVTFPVQLFTGSRSARNIPLHQIHEKTGKRVHNQPTVDGVGEIDRDDIVKGYEYKKGQYVTLEPDELAEIRLPTNKTIDIAEFADAGEIDLIYYDQPYYIIPQSDVGTDAYNTFQEALTKTGKVAIGEVVLGGKEHLIAIRPYGKGLMLETLRYANEVREAHSYFDDIKQTKINKDQLDLAVSLVKKKTKPFKIKDFEDSYETALQELIDRKLKKLPLRTKEKKISTNVISLMDALKKSVNGDDEKSAVKKAKAKSPATKARSTRKAQTHKPTARKTPAKRKSA